MNNRREGTTVGPRQGLWESEAIHVVRLVQELRLGWLLQHLPARIVWALYVSVNGFISIALLSALAAVTHNPFVFPSLGPTAYLFFFNPLGEASTPKNAILGHGLGLVCGYGAFWVCSQHHTHLLLGHGASWPRALAAALSLAGTGALMVLLRINHPPAGATTLIVSLGLLSKPEYLVVIEAAVVLLTIQAFVINRIAGLPYPIWHKEPGRPRSGAEADELGE